MRFLYTISFLGVERFLVPKTGPIRTVSRGTKNYSTIIVAILNCVSFENDDFVVKLLRMVMLMVIVIMMTVVMFSNPIHAFLVVHVHVDFETKFLLEHMLNPIGSPIYLHHPNLNNSIECKPIPIHSIDMV